MVLRICRQVIGDLQDAEDATQTVFLVLARKAGTIRVEGTVAPWLHGVAHRIAAKARGRATARGRAESQAARVAASIRDGKEAPGLEGWETVHREVDRLPDKYRAPVVLCYLQVDRWVAAARQRLDAQRAFYQEGRITIDRYIDASDQLMRAEMAASVTKDQRVNAAKANMDRIAEVVKQEQAELEKGRGTTADVAEALVAQERAACAYLEARQERGPYEVEVLRKRVEALEKQLARYDKVTR